MALKLLTANGEEHGLVNTLPNSSTTTGFEHMKPEIREKAEKMMKEDGKLIKARYRNNRNPLEKLTKPYCKYGGQPIQIWTFIHDHVYEVPAGLVKEVNDNPGLMQRSERLDEATGTTTKRDEKPFKIHEFFPVGF